MRRQHAVSRGFMPRTPTMDDGTGVAKRVRFHAGILFPPKKTKGLRISIKAYPFNWGPGVERVKNKIDFPPFSPLDRWYYISPLGM